MIIFHYIPSIDRFSGGTTTYLQVLAKELGKLSQLHVISHNSENPVAIENCKIHLIPSLLSFNGMKKEWHSLLNQFHPDIIHINCCWIPQCALVQKWSQQLGYKIVLTPHGMLEPWILKRHYWTKKLPALLLYQKSAIIKADYLHATAENEKINLLNLGYNTKVEVIANGIDINSIKLKSDWSKNKKILFLSRIHIKKGIEFLLEAIAKLKKQLQGYTIYIAGEGETNYIQKLKDKAESLEISNLISFCGGVYGDKKWELFRQADLFILPTYSENFGLVVAEALASGTPVITTKGAPWIELETSNCGWWIEIGSEPIVEALKVFLSCSEKDLEHMGKNGRQLIEEKYSAKKMAENMITLYQKVIKQ